PERRNVNDGGEFPFARNAALLDRSYVRSQTTTVRDDARLPPGRPVTAAPSPAGPAPGPARRRAVLVRSAVAVAVLAAAGGWLLTADPFAGRSSAATSAAYAFAPHRYGDGLVVSRKWNVAGVDGSRFTETISASSATGSAQRVMFEEPVLSDAVARLASARFTSARPKITDSGRVLQWQLMLPAAGSITVGYEAAVPAGKLSQSRLRDWASQFRRQASTLPPPRVLPLATGTVHPRSLAIRPRSVRLTAGHKTHLILSGVLASGRRASASELSAATWHSSDPSVARASPSGYVTAGRRTGTVTITVRLGGASAHIVVTVTAQAQEGAGGGPSPQPGTSGPGPKPGTHSPSPSTGVTTETPPPI
ncbi:MAG: Ig-like domain-containing protein, partial [Streptosporangiaceae bacterium]